MGITNKFLEAIQTHKESAKREKFHGFLQGYLELIEKQDVSPVLAHKRLYDGIISYGIETLDESNTRCNKIFDGEPVKIYDYFSADFFHSGTVLQYRFPYALS